MYMTYFTFDLHANLIIRANPVSPDESQSMKDCEVRVYKLAMLAFGRGLHLTTKEKVLRYVKRRIP